MTWRSGVGEGWGDRMGVWMLINNQDGLDTFVPSDVHVMCLCMCTDSQQVFSLSCVYSCWLLRAHGLSSCVG